MKFVLNLVATLFVATLATTSLAGGDHTPRHGGQMKETKTFDMEFVAKPDLLEVYLSDHGKAVDFTGATGKVTLLKGTEKQEFELKPVVGKLELKGKFGVAAGTKVVVQVTVGAKSATARYELK